MARSLWSGHVSFGLVTIPVRLATAVRDKSIHFHRLSPDGTCRLRQKLYCPETGREYDFNEAARGYQIAPDQYVIMDEQELRKLRPDAGRTIEILQFADLHEIDPIYFDHTYYLLPGEAGAKAYRLLADAMNKAHKAAIARFVIHNKQHLAVIRVRDESLVVHTMHYADEVLGAQDAGAMTEHVKLSPGELQMAEQLIGAMSAPFDARKYRDEYREQLEAIIRRKAEGEEVVTAAVEPEPPRIINIREALEQSLRQAHKGQKEKRAPTRRRKSA
jgi:DNA end-binding protein Ku